MENSKGALGEAEVRFSIAGEETMQLVSEKRTDRQRRDSLNPKKGKGKGGKLGGASLKGRKWRHKSASQLRLEVLGGPPFRGVQA